LLVTEREDAVAVTVNASDADNLSGAFVHLHYDASRFAPERVELGGMLGSESETVSLALTDVADYVPVGIAQITSSGVAPASGSGELATVYFAREPFAATRSASASPSGDHNAVTDLKIIQQETYTATLQWTEVNIGDYNNDGLVGVADLTPIGQNYNVEVEKSSDPLKVGLADGNKDGFVTLNDISQIGQNFGNLLTGYKLYKDVDGTNPYSDGITVMRSSFDGDRNHPIVYTYTADLPPLFVGFTVRPAAADDVANPGPLSNVAEPVDVPGPPEPPSNLTASSTEHQTVELDWTASISGDIDTYVIERKAVPDADWGPGLDVGNTTTYTDNDPSFVEGVYYEYRVHARDFTGYVSTYAELADPIMPYFVEGPDAPINVVADNDCGTAGGIEVQWDAPLDDTGVLFYRVYRQAPGETVFTPIFTSMNKFTFEYLNTGLTIGEYYEYYVVSVGAEAESDPSETVGNTPCEEVPEIHITGLTTDKTTHHSGGGEGVANLTVTTDVTPDSVDWSATAGTANGNGETATWEPTAGMDPVKVTVTCTVHAGPANDSATIDLYVTDSTILTQYGENNGHFIDFSLPCLEAIAISGDVIPDRPFTHYADGEHVVVLDRWESF
jgi:hypothetical protein